MADTSVVRLALLDGASQTGEVLFQLECQGIVADAQQDLDVLGVVQIAVSRGEVGRVGVSEA